MIELFLREEGGFYMVPSDGEKLISRPCEWYDGALPSGNSAAALVLVKLFNLTGEKAWRQRAERSVSYTHLFVLVPPVRDDMAILDRVKRALAPLGLGRITVASAQEHDRKIAFTSQLAHVVSNAYVKSETAQGHVGFSAGSYCDLTRVAWLAPEMWTELFLENQDNLLNEIDTLIGELGRYRAALAAGDGAGLCRLLQEGRDRKEAVDGCRP